MQHNKNNGIICNAKQNKKEKQGELKVINERAKVVEVIGWINIIGGIIGSLFFGEWSLRIVGIVVSIVGGVILLGFAEIINLLQERVNQSEKVILANPELNSNNNSEAKFEKKGNSLLDIKYETAMDLVKNSKFTEAKYLLQQLGDYKDSQKQLEHVLSKIA